MLIKRFQQLAQWVGFLAIAGLALYGFMSLGSGRLWAAGDESRPAAEDAPAITIPSTFNYQGFLRDSNGDPMGGTHKITLKLWKDVEATNVAALHTEEFPAVAVRDGLFNVLMGSLTSLDTNIFVDNAAIFVGITVDDTVEDPKPELLPRQRIHPVPWAILATSAQEATTAGTLSNGATVQNLTHIGPLSFNDTKHQIDTTSDQFTNGDVLRFFGPKGFSWVGADKNQYIMHLNDTTGLEVYGLNVAGTMNVSGVRPVLIKRYQQQTLNNTDIDTGIKAATYSCTVGGWFVNMDIDEIGYGPWGRSTYVNQQGNWVIEFYNKVHGQTPNPPISVDLICFHNNMVNWVNAAAATSAAGADAQTQPHDTTSEAVDQKNSGQ